MSKIIRISEFQHKLPLNIINEDFNVFYEQFLKSDLGKIHLATPFSEFSQSFKLKASKKGPDCIFSTKGKIALMMKKIIMVVLMLN